MEYSGHGDALTMLAYRIPRGANYTSTTRDYYCKHRRTKLSSLRSVGMTWLAFFGVENPDTQYWRIVSAKTKECDVRGLGDL